MSIIFSTSAIADGLDLGFTTSGLTGWTLSPSTGAQLPTQWNSQGKGANIVSAMTNYTPGGGLTWNITPYSGEYMASLQPTGSTMYTAMASSFGLSTSDKASIQSFLVAKAAGGQTTPTNASYMYYSGLNLTAGTKFTLAWNFVATDYTPWNDTSITSLVATTGGATPKINGYTQNYSVLGAINTGAGNWSTGSYGSTGWQVASYEVTADGTYTLGIGDFNLGDTALSPILLVSGAPGVTLKNGVAFGPITSNDPTIQAAVDAVVTPTPTPTPTPSGPVDVTNTSGTTATNPSGTTVLTVTNAGTYTNAGTAGNVANTGIFNNSGTAGAITNTSGTFTNTGTTGTVTNAGTFNNNTGGTTGSVTNTGTFTNAGTTGTVNNSNNFTNTGTTTTVTNASGTFTNTGTTNTVNNVGTFNNNTGGNTGAIANSGTFNNSGTTTTVVNNPAGTFTNDGNVTTVVNNGVFTNNNTAGGITNNSGTTTNAGTAGNIANYDVFNNSGTVGTVDNQSAGVYTNTGIAGDVTNTGAFTNNGTAGAVTNAGVFANNGTISSINNSGTFATGSATVGSYTQTATGSTVMPYGSILTVTGPASLDGNLTMTGTVPAIGKYSLLTGNDVSGTYSSYTGEGVLKYNPNSVQLWITPNAAATQDSIDNLSSSVSGMNSLQASVLNSSLGNDSNMYGEKGGSITVNYGNTKVGTGDLNTAGIIASKKIDDNWRVGVFADQPLNSSTVGTVTQKNNTGFGGFVAWNQNADQTGLGIQVSGVQNNGQATLKRNGPETGSGQANTEGKAYQVKASYTKAIDDKTSVTPYVGVRQTEVKTGGYTEQGPIFPLTVNSNTQTTTDVVAGVGVAYKVNDKLTATGAVGVTQNVSSSTGNFSGTSDIANKTTFNNVLPNNGKTSVGVGAGLSYAVTPNSKIGVNVGFQDKSPSGKSIGSVGISYTIGF